MAQLDGIPKSSAISRAPTIAIATVEQLLRGQHSYSKWAKGRTTSSCDSSLSIDPEEHHESPSVLARVKEKASMLRRSLSARRQSTADPNITPSWGVTLDDIDDHFYDEDTEHPIYESEEATETCKEVGNEHARAVILAYNHIIMTQTVNPEEVDPKALSEMIVDAMTPISAFGVVGKVRDAVNSLLLSSLTSVIKIPASHLSQLVPNSAVDAHQAAEMENRENIQTN